MNLPVLWEIAQVIVNMYCGREGDTVFTLASGRSVGCVQHHMREWEQDQQRHLDAGLR